MYLKINSLPGFITQASQSNIEGETVHKVRMTLLKRDL